MSAIKTYEDFLKYSEEIKKIIPQDEPIYFDQYFTIEGELLNKALFEVEKYGMTIEDVLSNIMYDNDYDTIIEYKEEMYVKVEEWIRDNVQEDFYFYELDQEVIDEIKEFVDEYYHPYYETESLKDAIEIDEVTIQITPEEYVEDALNELEIYQEELNPENENAKVLDIDTIKKAVNNNTKPDMINWLIQTQGYTLPDLYDNEKVENSKFLTSLKEEICDYISPLKGVLTVSGFNTDYDTFISVTEGKDNIKISPNSNLIIGIADTISGSGSGMNIELEKELVIPREWIKASYTVGEKNYGEVWYSITDIYGYYNEANADAFLETKEKPIKIERTNVNKIKENISKNQKEEEKKQQKHFVR